MPRLRAQAVSSGVVPQELINPLHEVWEYKQSALQFMKRQGLEVEKTAHYFMTYVTDIPECRHKYVAEQWAIANQMTTELPTGRLMANWSKLREAGVPVINTARLRWNRLKGAN